MGGLQKRIARTKGANDRRRGTKDPRLAQAIAAKRAGQPQEAARLYMQILEEHPANVDALTAFGELKYRLGDLSGARALFERALLEHPRNAKFLSNLAVVVKDQGYTAQARALFERAIESDSKLGAAHNNLGNLLKQEGDLTGARACFERALALDPNYRTALGNLAEVQTALGSSERALATLRRLLKLDPSQYDVQLKLGRALASRGDHVDAIAAYRHAVQLRPKSGTAHAELGMCFRTVGDWQNAAASLRQAENLGVESIETLTHLGAALTQLGRITEAAAHYQRIIDKQSDNIDALVRLALLSVELGHLGQAEQLVQRALALDPSPAIRSALAFVLYESGDFAEASAILERLLAETSDDDTSGWGERVTSRASALGLLSRCHLHQGLFERALETSQQAIEAYPNEVAPHVHRGVALLETSQFEAAQTAFEHVVALDPGHPTAHLNLAMCQLLRGDFVHGWEEYEWRLKEKRLRLLADRFAHLPVYRGESLPSKTLLVYCEQGFGDAIQFLRFAPELKQRCEGRLVVACRRSLMRLAASAPGIDQVVDRDLPLPPADACLALMSAPKLLGIAREGQRPTPGYLRVPEGVACPAPLEQPPERPRVGIVWAGSPKFQGDVKRSMRLDDWDPVLNVEGIEFVSLQVGLKPAPRLRPSMLDLAPYLHDFADTAAAIARLDLVVSVDTSVAHLAGALGTPVWNLIPKVPDWRWGTTGSTTAWYPSMQLFRQPEARDWASVLSAVTEALEAWRQAR